MDITYSRDYRQATDWLAQKRFALISVQSVRRYAERQRPGPSRAILDTGNWKEAPALDAIGGAYALMDKPAHPNARQDSRSTGCFLATARSRCNATAENAGGMDSLRIDIPKNDVNPLVRRKDGIKYLEMWNPSWMNMKPVEELIDQVMSEHKKS